MKEYKDCTKGKDVLLNASFGITLNANDTFGYACADATHLSEWDYWWAMPIADQYGQDGVHAIMAFIRNQDVLPRLINEKYQQALNTLKELNPECESRD